MISLYPYFSEPVEALILLLIAALSGLWAYARFKKGSPVSFIPVIILNTILLLTGAVMLGAAADETVHLHLSWLVSQGMVPYKDFWQHHPPFLWVLLSPLMSWIKPSVDVFYMARLFSGCVLALNLFLGWHIAKQVWGDKARLSVYLLILSSVALAAEFLLIRPDILMTFFLLCGIGISLEVPGKRVFPSFLAGMAFALAASFMIKQYALVLLPVMAIFLGGKHQRPLKMALYLAGFVAGCVPLFSYLASYHIVKDYIFWVFQFNPRLVVLSIGFPLGIMLLAGWGAYLLFKRSKDLHENKALVVCMAFCLSTLSSLTTTSVVGQSTYLALWFFISGIVASGLDILQMMDRVPCLFKRAVLYGVIFSLFVSLSIDRALQCRDPLYNTPMKTVAQLMKYCANDTCITFSPSHPIFAHDATRLYSVWPYSFSDWSLSVRKDILSRPIAYNIMTVHPALIPHRYGKQDFIVDLFQKRLIAAPDYKKVIGFLKEHYTKKKIGEESYYIRNDKIGTGP